MSNAVDVPAIKLVEQWILERRPEWKSIPHDVDLIDNRIVDSLAFVEFVLYIENLSGSTIDLDNLDVEDFRTLATIDMRFLRRD